MRGLRGATVLLAGLFCCARAESYTPGRPFKRASPEDERRVQSLVARAWGARSYPCHYQKDEVAVLRDYGHVVVPDLLRALQSKRPRHRWNAAYLLSIVDDPATIPSLLRKISRRDVGTSDVALEALLTMSDESTACFYLDALREEYGTPCEQRCLARDCPVYFCIWMLGRLKCVEAVPAIIPHLRGPHSGAAREAIREIGGAAGPALLAELKAHPRDSATIGLLGELRVEGAVDDLVAGAVEGEALHDEAVLALGRIGNREAVKALKGLAEERRSVVSDTIHQFGRGYMSDSRALVCTALGYAKDPSAVDVLEKLLAKYDGSPELRSYCVAALGRLQAADALVRILKDRDRGIAMRAAIALAEMGDARGAELLAAAFGDERLCQRAISASARLIEKSLVPHLIDALRRSRAVSPGKKRYKGIPVGMVIEPLCEITNRAYGPLRRDGRVDRWKMMEDDRMKALRAYEAWWEENKGRSREEWLIADIRSPDEKIVHGAIKRLGKSRCRGAVAVLVNVLLSEDLHTRIYAIEALGRIGDPSALPSVKAVPKPHINTGCTSWHWETLSRARLALGDKSVIPELIRALRNYDSFVQTPPAESEGRGSRNEGRIRHPESSDGGSCERINYGYADRAAGLLQSATGVSFEHLWRVPKVRERGATKWEMWWWKNGDDFVLEPVRWE